ncbi:hypothetical protein N7534_005717 [Penicillium rubens]|nr:hypothetical protein N7534_005717 [Penicillium rubens]
MRASILKRPKEDPEDTGMHTTQIQSDGDGETSRNAVLEAETTQQPENTLDERPENRPSPNTFTALDTRQRVAFHYQQWEFPVRLGQKTKSGWQ